MAFSKLLDATFFFFLMTPSKHNIDDVTSEQRRYSITGK